MDEADKELGRQVRIFMTSQLDRDHAETALAQDAPRLYRELNRLEDGALDSIQCPFSGKIYYRAHLEQEATPQESKEKIVHDILLNQVASHTQFIMDNYLAIIIKGNNNAVNSAWNMKAQKMLAENSSAVAIGRHRNMMNRVFVQLRKRIQKVPPVVEAISTPTQDWIISNALYEMMHCPDRFDDLDLGVDFLFDPYSVALSHGIELGPKPSKQEMREKLYQDTIYIDESGERDYANMNFYHPKYSLDYWSCTRG